jgi:RimJ/RimL family protein N-acetyltransferase
MTADGLTDERILTARLELVPVIADDADELIEVFGDERLYVFLGSRPTTTEELRDQFAGLEAARLADTEGTAQRNWTVRRRSDGRAVGMLQVGFSDHGRAAEIAWAVGCPGRAWASPPRPPGRWSAGWSDAGWPSSPPTSTPTTMPPPRWRPGRACGQPTTTAGTRAFVSNCGAGGSPELPVT